jgi:hypothetical protein
MDGEAIYREFKVAPQGLSGPGGHLNPTRMEPVGESLRLAGTCEMCCSRKDMRFTTSSLLAGTITWAGGVHLRTG